MRSPATPPKKPQGLMIIFEPTPTPDGSQNGGRLPLAMEPEEYERLKNDFLSSQNGGEPKAGSYRADKDGSIEILLRFDKIICITNRLP